MAVDGGGDGEQGDVDAFRQQLMRQFGTASESETDAAGPPELPLQDSMAETAANREQLMRQFGFSDATDDATPSEAETEQVQTAAGLKAGILLVANPLRFCSRNPFARPVNKLERFGLQGPIAGDSLSPDAKAQMLPVLFLTQHDSEGSKALLLERRTGALMGDISMDDFGCVAISPLWLGGTESQNSLSVLHTVEDLPGAVPIGDGLWLGGWSAARPKVADSSLSEERFKFFLGSTEWGPSQLEAEVKSGAWLLMQATPELLIKNRVMDWRPGKPKPLWTELVQLMGEEYSQYFKAVYSEG